MTQPWITIDVSHTFGSGKNTGIERVVRNLCREIPRVLDERGFESPKLATHFQGRFIDIDPTLEERLRLLGDWERNAQEFVPDWIQVAPKWIASVSGSRKLRKWMEPQASHLGIYKLPHHLLRWSTLSQSVLRGKTIEPGSTQILILPDAYWTRRDIWKTVQAHRSAGALISTIVYDLIPLTHPQFVGRKRSHKFKNYLDQVIRYSDTIVAISETVAQDVRNYIADQPDPLQLCRDIRSFVLGAELSIPRSDSTHGSVRPIINSLFDTAYKNPPYLMVASFDPRKNHQQALDAFDLLWKTQPELNLCFAGRTGSMCGELMERIENHPKFERGLWVFHDLSDIELNYAYERCSGVLLPSIVEGFGLPIVESLWHGRKTFASDTPIHREVGGKHCEYFQLHNPEDLANGIRNWEAIRQDAIQNRDGFGQSDRFRPKTWQQSASQLTDIVLDAWQAPSKEARARA
ncbi:MAG: glycosyltransferase family 4 protein, partial [Pirellula sp.]